ncbi:hypothetical protein I3842_06G046300 [Carya illinoinensis]|uniref:Uncharacterized protein n=1 Tax=Carya illinoinensis TaxID=32201 RepID=A0A922EQL5_CARIL|nr:hypothetical protein I3842_06G046300 [Carya illinoinensis]
MRSLGGYLSTLPFLDVSHMCFIFFTHTERERDWFVYEAFLYATQRPIIFPLFSFFLVIDFRKECQELENYAMYKVEENTEAVNNCLKISEDNREDARRTLEKLHHQGEQITRTHMMNADIEKDLSQ